MAPILDAPGPALSAGTVALRYITNGSGSGHVVLTEYGRGEPMELVNTTNNDFHHFTNPDVFLLNSPYQEPRYETRGFFKTDAIPDPNSRIPPACRLEMCAQR